MNSGLILGQQRNGEHVPKVGTEEEKEHDAVDVICYL